MPLFGNRAKNSRKNLEKKVIELFDASKCLDDLINNNVWVKTQTTGEKNLKILSYVCALSLVVCTYKWKSDLNELIKEIIPFWAGRAVKNKERYGYSCKPDKLCAKQFSDYFLNYLENPSSSTEYINEDSVNNELRVNLIEILEIPTIQQESIDFLLLLSETKSWAKAHI